MKLIIDIPKRIYDVIQIRKDMTSELHEAVRNGIPLEDIKAQIEKRADDYLIGGSYDADLYNGAYRDALYWCFDLLDEHIGGE